MLQNYLEAIKYRITDSYEYQWHSYGRDAFGFEHEDQDNSYYTACIFDTLTTDVYEIRMIDYNREYAYIWINPEYRDSYFAEAAERNVNPLEAVGETDYTELYIIEDILDKIVQLISGNPYDTKVLLPLDLPTELYDELSTIAKLKNITIEQLIEEVIAASIEEYETSNSL